MTWTRSRVAAFVVGGVIGVLLMYLILDLVSAPQSAASKLRNGREPYAPALVLRRLDGPGRLRLADLQGKTILLSFWASWCGGCKDEAHELADLSARWHDKGLIVVGVNVHDNLSSARAFARSANISYTLVRDSGETAATSFGVSALPTTFIVSPEGRVINVWVGLAEPGALGAAVRSLLG